MLEENKEKTTTILFSSLSGYKEAKITHVVCSMKRLYIIC